MVYLIYVLCPTVKLHAFDANKRVSIVNDQGFGFGEHQMHEAWLLDK